MWNVVVYCYNPAYGRLGRRDELNPTNDLDQISFKVEDFVYVRQLAIARRTSVDARLKEDAVAVIGLKKVKHMGIAHVLVVLGHRRVIWRWITLLQVHFHAEVISFLRIISCGLLACLHEIRSKWIKLWVWRTTDNPTPLSVFTFQCYVSCSSKFILQLYVLCPKRSKKRGS